MAPYSTLRNKCIFDLHNSRTRMDGHHRPYYVICLRTSTTYSYSDVHMDGRAATHHSRAYEFLFFGFSLIDTTYLPAKANAKAIFLLWRHQIKHCEAVIININHNWNEFSEHVLWIHRFSRSCPRLAGRHGCSIVYKEPFSMFSYVKQLKTLLVLHNQRETW